ncbi:ethanolamine-phosphate cytidylyltransferase-like [Euphorbia lathyris]|uniref:ethanolamine-phosphate cytidylyltransferase-like n=1 Tax=Euphorbia lathyris TaxID=212925 RepID=UPI003313107B
MVPYAGRVRVSKIGNWSTCKIIMSKRLCWILRYARQLGDFLLVGIHTDQIVSEHRGKHYPLMHLHERSLSVLACPYVDEVIIGKFLKTWCKTHRDAIARRVLQPVNVV